MPGSFFFQVFVLGIVVFGVLVIVEVFIGFKVLIIKDFVVIIVEEKIHGRPRRRGVYSAGAGLAATGAGATGGGGTAGAGAAAGCAPGSEG